MRAQIPILLALPLAGLVACGGGADDEASALPTPEDTVEAAVLQFDAAAFDSITWEEPATALERGGVVFAYSCQKCHGAGGFGDGGFVMQGDTVRPPSFREPDWRFADDLEGLRRQIFIGTTKGMPHWGLEGLDYRDIDAVARFIQTRLRN